MNGFMSNWFLAATGLYSLSTLLWFTAVIRPTPRGLRWARWSLGGSLIFQFALLLCWLLRAGSGGATRLLLGLGAAALAALLLGLTRYRGERAFEALIAQGVALVTFLALASSLFGQDLGPRAPWLVITHVSLSLAGVIAFTFAALAAALYLRQATRLKKKELTKLRRLPSLASLDQLSLRGMSIGFPLYSGGLLLGSAQALSSGQLKLSDLIAAGSWLLYGALLQARLTAGWRGRRAAWLTIIAQSGLLIVIIAYLWR